MYAKAMLFCRRGISIAFNEQTNNQKLLNIHKLKSSILLMIIKYFEHYCRDYISFYV